MAAPWLGVDVHAVRKSGPRVTLVDCGLLVMLVTLGITLIRLFQL